MSIMNVNNITWSENYDIKVHNKDQSKTKKNKAKKSYHVYLITVL